MYYKSFQKIRVYQDWQVTHNNFTDAIEQLTPNDPELQYRSSYDVISFFSQTRNLSIHVEWKFEENKGYYKLEVYRVLEVFNAKTNTQELQFEEKPHITFTSSNTEELIEKLEELLWFVEPYEDPRILKNRGEIDEPSETYRITLLNKGFSSELIDKILVDGNKQIQHIALSHKDINKDIILRFKEKSRFSKMKNKAEQLLKNKKYRNIK